ncbi:hypothetical protein CSC70_02470 [Pseudoxanthomonas kalamensis DSM 18571]|uniref:BPSS1780 family membrane protein n=1 Tax=Pseudoxanthomonas kalamensis TaxID=289483 RepID=UPI0013916E7A|nr:BPSS1780 family membrane protein [Pseudoxanthomonas kalamensis]KAF1712403.1 hypothetical protein CSC70_02470 [Pseudoxanthomonas kalamensis DSM 18571]
MPDIKTVPASAGAQWLLDAFAVLRKAPLGLGLLGIGWGLLAMAAMLVSMWVPTLGLALQLVVSLLGPALFAGLLWAVREVDQGRAAQPAHLWQGLRNGRMPALLSTLLPQLGAGVVLGLGVLVLVGADGMKQIVEVAEQIQAVQEAGGTPDPAMVEGLPAGRVLLCLLLALALVPAVVCLIFVSVPQIIFSGSPGLAAMGRSLRACLRNLPAMIVFGLLLFITMFALGFATQIAAMLIQLLFGPAAAVVLMNLLLMAVLMPLLAGVAYFAWRQMLGEAVTQPPAVDPSRIEL